MSVLFLIEEKPLILARFSSQGSSLGLREAVQADTTQETGLMPLRGIGDRPSGLAISGTAIPIIECLARCQKVP